MRSMIGGGRSRKSRWLRSNVNLSRPRLRSGARRAPVARLTTGAPVASLLAFGRGMPASPHADAWALHSRSPVSPHHGIERPRCARLRWFRVCEPPHVRKASPMAAFRHALAAARRSKEARDSVMLVADFVMLALAVP